VPFFRQLSALSTVLTDVPGGQVSTLRLILASHLRLSNTQTTGQAADVIADVACDLTGADGAHVYLPEQLGQPEWSNANEARTSAPRRTLVFDVTREIPDLRGSLDRCEDLFVPDALATGAARRPLRLRYVMSSLLFVPLLDFGVLVLWWNQPRVAAPDIGEDGRNFLDLAAQVLQRRMETTTLRDLSLTDPLTKLGNRRALLQALTGLTSPGALMLLDLDHFKRVNDTLGHQQGDLVLQAFATLLRTHSPAGSCVARYGGEEFAVVYPHDGRHAAEREFATLQEAWLAKGMSFSAGVAEHRDGATVDETLEAADRALYRAKDGGRNRLAHAAQVAWTDDDLLPSTVPRPRAARQSASGRRIGVNLAELDAALDSGLVVPHYQPVINLKTGRVVAVEALARLTHPTSGTLLTPAHFLPLAERAGRVGRIDQQVATAAIADVAGWRRTLPDGEISVAVNVSIAHLDDSHLPEYLLEVCRREGLPPNALIVELTETLDSVTGLGHEASVERLRAAGVNVTLDDFGTGFSSLAYLLRFPVAGVKIDRSFTAALDTERGRRLVLGILGIGAALDLHVVAEGVETPAQLSWLEENGCVFAQGYLLSRPVPGAELPHVLAALNAA
jgi:diguanylate cyclase (GGDEF)-like protein